MSLIKRITVNNRVAHYNPRCGKIICNNPDYKIKFIFDSEWSSHNEKTARFIWGGGYVDKTFTGDECPVPPITGASELIVGVFAGDLKTTTDAVIPCTLSIKCKSGAPRAEQVEVLKDRAEAAAERAEAAAENAAADAVEAVSDAVVAKIAEIGIVQTTGASETAVMSQKAVSDELYSEVALTWELGAVSAEGEEYHADNVCRTVEYIDARAIHSISVIKTKVILGYNGDRELIGYTSIPANTTWYKSNILALGDVRYFRLRSAWNEIPDTVDKVTVYEDKKVKTAIEEIDKVDGKCEESFEKIAKLEERIAPFDSHEIRFEDGGLNATDGQVTASSYTDGKSDRVRSGFLAITETSIISFDGSFSCCVFRYDEEKNYIDNTTGTWSNITVIDCSKYLTDNCKYVRILVNTRNTPSPVALFSEEGYLKRRVDEIELELTSGTKYKGKYCSIYGDSISTFAGWIPDGNRVYYTGSNSGVTDVSQTWWKRVIDHFDMKLLVNNSWSGRCVSDKRDTESNMINSAGARLENILQLATANQNPDVIIIRLGTNDFNYSTPIGSYDGHTHTFPTEISSFRDAYAIMLDNMLSQFPTAELWCATIPYCNRGQAFPTIINSNTLADFNKVIIEMADLFGCKVLHQHRCGITYRNIAQYMGDGDTHPNADGHELLAKQTIREMTY